VTLFLKNRFYTAGHIVIEAEPVGWRMRLRHCKTGFAWKT